MNGGIPVAGDVFTRRVAQRLQPADVRLDGGRPWDIRVHDPRFAAQVLATGSLGFGESYMDEGWDADDLDGLLFRLMRARVDRHPVDIATAWTALKARLVNLQSRRRSFEVGRRHYDLGNDLYQAMLGRRLVYSCGYWRTADTWTLRRRPSSTWSAASWAWRRACACWTSAAAGAKR